MGTAQNLSVGKPDEFGFRTPTVIPRFLHISIPHRHRAFLSQRNKKFDKRAFINDVTQLGGMGVDTFVTEALSKTFILV